MYYGYKKGSKYHNKKTYSSDGILHASVKEANRWAELCLLQKAGKISELERQVRFELIPAQYDEVYTGELYKRGDRKGEPKKKRVCIEESCAYVADFVYKDHDTGLTVVEDTKGFKTPDYILKRKLMLYTFGIRIKEL